MNKRENILEEFEQKIGFVFKNNKLLDIALTHSSYANNKKNVKYNERLEFLGDSVLQLCISEYLFNLYSDKDEGELTRNRALIVCENSLYIVSKKFDIGKYMKMSRGEELTGGRSRESILADCVEAVIAAIYLDSGMEYAEKFILSNFKDIIDKVINNQIILDYKTRLQEMLQKHGEVSISYSLITFIGPPHRRKFFMEVSLKDKELGRGSGFSKKEAEQNAAKDALKRLGYVYE